MILRICRDAHITSDFKKDPKLKGAFRLLKWLLIAMGSSDVKTRGETGLSLVLKNPQSSQCQVEKAMIY